MIQIDVTELREDAKAAETLLNGAIESCERLHKDLNGSDAAAVTRITKGLRIALDRVGCILDQLDPKVVGPCS